MTQRTRLPDMNGSCNGCGDYVKCRWTKVVSRPDEAARAFIVLCAPCLSVLNGPLEAPVFTGIKGYRFRKQGGVVEYSVHGGWSPVFRNNYPFFAGDPIWHPTNLRAIADALESV